MSWIMDCAIEIVLDMIETIGELWLGKKTEKLRKKRRLKKQRGV